MVGMKGSLKLVGAGPGDPELISVKGMKALSKADVILYDALVSKELFSYAKPGCKLVYVGKRKGKKEFPQDEINKLLVFYATRFENVVRLKGGDPNVFGRGHEEFEFVSRHGIDVDLIPGISSAIAAPSAAGIPLTKRGVNESFWVITGTLSSGEMSNDIHLAAKSSATVIILMGVSHLEKIARLFLKERSSSEPIAVIQEATMPGQKVVTGTVSNIARLVCDNGITSPAVIIIGKVVGERKTLYTMLKQTRSTSLLTSNQ
jgi:uroporphyrin-III C-methyltransferase